MEIDAPDGATERRGVLLWVAYDGAPFVGFARQREGRSVAGELDGAVRALDPSASLVRGTSRTDAGVHALAHPVAFDTSLEIPPRGWALALAAHLPDEISVVGAATVMAGYDPRTHARRKTYRYVLLEAKVRDPFSAGRAWRIPEWLNQEAMSREARDLLGQHDFRAFRTSKDPRPDTVRTIFRADVCVRDEAPGRRTTTVEVEGDRFLHRMVRIIVGALVDTGRGRLPAGSVRAALETGERARLGITAPPDGLYLVRVELADAGRHNWPDHLPSR
jgi:tRNA pseudouridine38-40 synthase